LDLGRQRGLFYAQTHDTGCRSTESVLSETTGGFAVLDAGDSVGALWRIRETVAQMPVKP
jgi:hypothetical protein